MASPFDALDVALSASCLAQFGEAALIRPRRASQYSEPAPDPQRPAMSVTGIYSAGPGETPIKGKSMGTDFSGPTRFITMRAEFWLDASTVAALPHPIARGDLLVLSDADQTTFEVVALQRTDMGDLNLILAIEGQSA